MKGHNQWPFLRKDPSQDRRTNYENTGLMSITGFPFNNRPNGAENRPILA